MTIDWDSNKRQGILVGELLSVIREKLSVQDENLQFAKRRNPFRRNMPERRYVITPTGRFEPRLWPLIVQAVQEVVGQPGTVELTESFKKAILYPLVGFKPEQLTHFDLKPRDYQLESLLMAGKKGTGIIVLPTSAGKTLVIAMLAHTYARLTKKKVMILVPDLQLVAQTYSDLVGYGIPEGFITKWTGTQEPNEEAQIWVANQQIFLKQQDYWKSRNHLFYTFLCDECHKLRHGNQINKVLKDLKAPIRFGFTGSFPEPLLDQWAIIGLLGPIIYQQASIDLREQKYITSVKVKPIHLHYTKVPVFAAPSLAQPTAGYEDELTFLHSNEFRNAVIIKLSKNLDNNALILVDRIVHGEVLLDLLKEHLPEKEVFFIQGSVEVDERELLRKKMENQNNIVCIAISKIFSTGLNIKNLHYILFAAIGKARIKIIQSVGRSLRLHHSKQEAIIYDLCDQLRYGQKHFQERLQIYETETIPLDTPKHLIEPC